jgi:cytochrome b subunit of formate dehydrogenase
MKKPEYWKYPITIKKHRLYGKYLIIDKQMYWTFIGSLVAMVISGIAMFPIGAELAIGLFYTYVMAKLMMGYYVLIDGIK